MSQVRCRCRGEGAELCRSGVYSWWNGNTVGKRYVQIRLMMGAVISAQWGGYLASIRYIVDAFASRVGKMGVGR